MGRTYEGEEWEEREEQRESLKTRRTGLQSRT
jgi:hypothetical protein